MFYVKSLKDSQLIKKPNSKVTHANGYSRPTADINKVGIVSSPTRVDSGYDSHPETIRISGSPRKSSLPTNSEYYSTAPQSAISSPERQTSSNIYDKRAHAHESAHLISEKKSEVKSPIMSYYTTDIISPMSSARKQEKEDLQMLNDRFSTYIQKVRLLSEQNNRLDSSTFVKQTRILEEEVANLKTLYERELDVLR